MKTREPKINIHGPIAEHDQACAVLYLAEEKAVYCFNGGIFQPSWAAQEQGYILVKADTPFKKWLIKFFKLGV